MKLPHNAHVAVVDGNRFMLLQNTGQPFEPSLKMVEEPSLDPSGSLNPPQVLQGRSCQSHAPRDLVLSLC